MRSTEALFIVRDLFSQSMVERAGRARTSWRRHRITRLRLSISLAGLMVASGWGEVPGRVVLDALGEEPVRFTQEPARFTQETLTGQVVWLDEAMLRLQGVQWADDARRRVLAVETADGHLIPLVEDVRGRGFRKDERLRGRPVELLVRRYAGSPTVQVLKLYEWETVGQGAAATKQKYELDYWCSVCAIAMFELKRCECCQGETELRRRLIKP